MVEIKLVLVYNIRVKGVVLMNFNNIKFKGTFRSYQQRILDSADLISTIISCRFESHQNLTFESRKLMVRVRGQSPIVVNTTISL